MLRVVLVLCLCLSGCIDVPELDQAVPEWVNASDYPELVSLDGLQSVEPPDKAAEALEDELTARSGQLKRRADGLSGPVVDPETRARMAGGVSP